MKKRTFFKNLLKFVGLIVLTLVMNSLPLGFIGTFASLEVSPLVQNIISIIWLILTFFIMRYLWIRIVKYDTANASQEKMRFKDIVIGIAIYFLMIFYVAFGSNLITQFTGETETVNNAAIMEIANQAVILSWGPLLVFFVTISFCAPIIEELTFRVYGTNKFFLNSRGFLAGIVTSSIFGVLHSTTFLEFLLYTGMGYILFLAYRRRGNVKDSILVHMINNTFASLFFLIPLLF